MARRLGFEVRRSYRSPVQLLLNNLPTPTAQVLDVGANRGQFATMILDALEAEVVCFEPLAAPVAELRAMAARYPGRVEIVTSAVGSEHGQIAFFEHTKRSTSSSALEATPEAVAEFRHVERHRKIEVPIDRLDDLLDSRGIRVVPTALLKIDTQGYELQVLQGADRTLREVASCLVEVNYKNLYRGQAEFHSIVAVLADRGLAFRGLVDQYVNRSGLLVFGDALFLRTNDS